MKTDNDSAAKPPAPRRGFLKGLIGLAGVSFAAAVPVWSGLKAFLHPLKRTKRRADFVMVTSLNALPADDRPRKFPIVLARQDAWTQHPLAPVGMIFLRRTSEKTVQALNVICPHAGCIVDYRPGQADYLCPCHNSRFAKDGSIGSPESPSPRPLDALEVEIRNETEVWVRFQNFQPGIKDKVAQA